MTLDEFIKELKPYLDKDMVIFTGAGLSTASGIKDFRGKNGLFKEKINAEEILSHHFFMENPIEFYKFFRDKLINDNVKPNLMHEVIAMLEEEGVVSGVITQNIDLVFLCTLPSFFLSSSVKSLLYSLSHWKAKTKQ